MTTDITLEEIEEMLSTQDKNNNGTITIEITPETKEVIFNFAKELIGKGYRWYGSRIDPYKRTETLRENTDYRYITIWYDMSLTTCRTSIFEDIYLIKKTIRKRIKRKREITVPIFNPSYYIETEE